MGLVVSYRQNTEPVTLIHGRLYKPDATRRGIVYCHSADLATVAQHYEPYLGMTAWQSGLLGLCEQMGLPLISGDNAGAQTWGNDAAQTKVSDARTYLSTALGGKIDKVILVGLSMGGMVALNWARANPTLVKAIVLLYPAVNLQAIHDGTGGAAAAAASTEAAYGGTLGSFNAAVAAHDPAQHATDYAGVPIKMYYSTADTVVGSANQTAFASAVGGSAFQSYSLGASSHGDMSVLPVADIQSFLAPHAS